MFATVATMVAPAGKYRKFVSLVMGFILLAAMLAPLARFSGDIPVTQWFSGVVPEGVSPDSAYATWRSSYLSQAFTQQLEAQLAGMLGQQGFQVHSASFTYADDFSRLTSVTVAASREEENRPRQPFIRIQPVQVGAPQADNHCETATEIKSLISQFYNLDKAHIHVEVRH